MSSERALGNRWAAKLRAEGWFVQKIPASSVAGFPDWLIVDPDGIMELVEAKLAGPGRQVFRPGQLSRAQRWFLEQVSRRGGSVWVLVLAEDGYALLEYGALGKIPLTRKEFNYIKEPYDHSEG